MTRTIKVNSKLTHNQFGAKQSIFEEHIRGKELPVLSFDGKFYQVEVAGEQYSVCKSDVDRCHHIPAE